MYSLYVNNNEIVPRVLVVIYSDEFGRIRRMII